MYRPWGLVGVALLVLLFGGYGLVWAAGSCTFAWDKSPSAGVDAYRLYGAPTSGGQVAGQNFVHVPVTALSNPALPQYMVPCEELSWWKATSVVSGSPLKESGFSNEVQVPAFPLLPPANFRLEVVTQTSEGTAIINQSMTLQKATPTR